MKSCCGRRAEPWFGRLTCWRACRRIWSSPDARRISRRNARGCNGASLYVGHQHLYLHPAHFAQRRRMLRHHRVGKIKSRPPTDMLIMFRGYSKEAKLGIPQNSKWKTRLIEGGFPDRSFDIEFWQEQGDEAIFAAAWEMVELAEETSHGRKPRIQRTLQLLNEFEVDYLIVGGFAVMKYGEPRYTKDLDVWIHNSLPNCIRAIGALKKFGAPLDNDGITAETFSEKQVVYQIGIAPVRIDILTAITGVEFANAWKNKVRSTFFGVPVHFISQADLEANKRALGRASDLEDLKGNPKNRNFKK